MVGIKRIKETDMTIFIPTDFKSKFPFPKTILYPIMINEIIINPTTIVFKTDS